MRQSLKMQGWVNIFETSNKIYAELYVTKEAAEADRRMADADPEAMGKCIAQISWIEGMGLNG